jgi:hypothetical protein
MLICPSDNQFLLLENKLAIEFFKALFQKEFCQQFLFYKESIISERMIHQWLSRLNYVLLGIVIFLCLTIYQYWSKNTQEIVNTPLTVKPSLLPKNSFELKEEDYHTIGKHLLELNYAPPELQVPDLRQQIIYYGKNGRPDAQNQNILLHFALSGANKTLTSVAPNQPLYLFYDKKSTPPHYIFSPNNAKTSLWIQAIPLDTEAEIHVTLEKQDGDLIKEPANLAQFRLTEKELARQSSTNWEIGTFRVDGTLLARQKSRWYGPDRFLEQHGGEEYQDVSGKQRIDFGENDKIYSIFVKVGDCLVWDKDHWQPISPKQDSLSHPLLVVKKIDERLMTFDLWDVEGKGKITLNLLKSSEPWSLHNIQLLQQMFKFVAARTRSQSVFEINKERMILSPSDWLLFTNKGWQKLDTEEEIDQYVKRKISGSLFVFEGIAQVDDKRILKGTLYSPSRNDFQEVEIPLQVGRAIKETTGLEIKQIKGKETVDPGETGIHSRENETLRQSTPSLPKEQPLKARMQY